MQKTDSIQEPNDFQSVQSSTAGFAHPPRTVAAMQIELGMKVADFGSGSGAYALLFADAVGPQGRVYAIDIQKDLLRRTHTMAVQKNLHNIEIIWGDVELPHGSKLADKLLDLVLISNLLFQVTGKGELMKEARRVLKSGGRLVVVDWSDSFGGLGPQPGDIVTEEKARILAQAHGFLFQKSFDAGAHHYGMIFDTV